MTPRGRPPKPTAKHKLDGTYRKDRHDSRSEPSFKAAGLRAPAELSTKAKAEWKRLAPELKRLGMWTEADRAFFMVYCQAYGDWVEATLELKGMKSLTFETDKGYVAPHPLVGIRDKAWRTMKDAGGKFGFSPSDRARLSIDVPPEGKAGDPDEAFLFGDKRLSVVK